MLLASSLFALHAAAVAQQEDLIAKSMAPKTRCLGCGCLGAQLPSMACSVLYDTESKVAFSKAVVLQPLL